MIERPAPTGASVAHAGAEAGGPVKAAAEPQIAAVTEAECAPHVLAGFGPDPALAPPAPPKFQDRPGPLYVPTVPRAAARRTPRAATTIEGIKYRVVFACCMQATETPTE
jgi:hypothetical protein